VTITREGGHDGYEATVLNRAQPEDGIKMQEIGSSQQKSSSAIRFIYDSRVRGWLAQVIILFALLVVVGYGLNNIGQNLHKAGITTGFGFLNEPSGFDISQTLVEYSSKSSYADALLVGILNTLLVSVLGIFFSTFLGFFLGVIRLSPNWLVSRMAMAYTEIIRNIPLLLQVLFWYLAIFGSLARPSQCPGYEWPVFFSATVACRYQSLFLNRVLWQPPSVLS
jgi:general L-amino acid transport system permease protein